MMIEEYRDWSGSAENLADVIETLAATYVSGFEPPNLRVIRDWRSKGIFSQPKQKPFGFRQVLEGIAAFWWLSKKGWPAKVIVENLAALTDGDLYDFIVRLNSVPELPPTTTRDARRQARDANIAVVLLARGILNQYEYTVLGRHGIVRQTQPHGDQGGIHKDLRLAISKLGRLQVESVGTDEFACVHEVLRRARASLSASDWNMPLFDHSDFEYRDVRLIDPVHLTPTVECQDIAAASGAGEADLIERRLHDQLRNIVSRSVIAPSQIYSAVRGFIGRNPLVVQSVVNAFALQAGMRGFYEAFGDFYDEIHEGQLIEGVAHQCAYCRALMRPRRGYPDGICSVEPCSSTHRPKVGARLDPQNDRVFVAAAAVMTFWVTPAYDEIQIYEAARRMRCEAELYPDEDACDVSINGRQIGIDAKNYSSPAWLARKLNSSIGRLRGYKTRVIAISDYLLRSRRDYLDALRASLLRKGEPSTLRVMGVSQVIKWLKQETS